MSTKKEAEKLVNEVMSGGVSRREFVTRGMALGLSLSTIGMVLAKNFGSPDPRSTGSRQRSITPVTPRRHLPPVKTNVTRGDRAASGFP